MTPCLQCDCLALNSINGRVYILSLEGNELVPVETPDALYQEIPSGYHILNHADSDNPYIYIVSSEMESSIYLFDTETKEFTEILPPDTQEYDYRYLCGYGQQFLVEGRNRNNQPAFYTFNVSMLNG